MVSVPATEPRVDLPDAKASYPNPWKNFLDNVHWEHFLFIGSNPIIALYGAFTTNLCWQTAVFSIFYYFFTGYVFLLLQSNHPH